MSQAAYSPTWNAAASRRSTADRFLVVALVASLALHGGFVLWSYFKIVNVAQQAQDDLETLFKVNLDQLTSSNFVSRPNQRQLIEERERVLEQEVIERAEARQRAVEGAISQMGVPFDGDVPSSQGSSSDLFIDDRSAQNLVTSELGKASVMDFEDDAGVNSIMDNVAPIPKMALLGRGTGSGRSLLANLPPPVLDDQPAVQRSMENDILAQTAPPVPDVEAEDPPIILPPVTELLPSPDLIKPSDFKSTLPSEEAAKQAIEERFVKLDDLLDVELKTYHHIGGDGYFMLRLRPKGADDRLRVLPKDVVFVLDASRSMGSRRLRTIKGEVNDMLGRMREGDRFNVVGFKGRVDLFTETLAPVSPDSIQQAKEFLIDLDSSGHTDIYRSMEPLVKLGVERARPLILLLFSDGRPSVGVVNSRKIINNLTQYRGPSTSIFCVGSGMQINRYLLDMLAFRNRGLVAFEPEREGLPQVIQSVYGYVEDPVLLRVEADFGFLDKSEVFPKRLPDLFLKGELRIWGRLQQQDYITVRITGEAFDEQKETILRLPVPEIDNATFEVARQWALHKIYDLIGRMVEEGETPQILQEIQSISDTYNVVTPYSEQID
ncbi:MAG: VWA domain-containing protein [Candidatus Hinthialibacter antarcticus]|nr:VWA domain-containing protein [Candidatus Hinthialibacter antarcticus]